MRFFDRAALFAEACLEYGLLPTDDSSVCILFEQAPFTTEVVDSIITNDFHMHERCDSHRTY